MKPIVIKKYLNLVVQSSRQKVLKVLFNYPDKEFSLSDLAKEASVAKPNIGAILQEFERARLISITKLAKIWRIKANQQNWNFVKAKIIYNLNFVYQSGLVEFLNQHFGNPKAIILFGSFRQGEDFSGSDIDIAIEADEVAEYRIIGLRELVDFEKVIKRRIQLHIFNRKNVDSHVFNNIANGIVLAGFLEVKP